MRGMTAMHVFVTISLFFISIHMPHAGHDYITTQEDAVLIISIHMPHAGHDPDLDAPGYAQEYFNPHAPCGA